MASAGSSGSSPPSAGLTFVDFLFTLAIGLGVSGLALSQGRLPSILMEPWVLQFRFPNPTELEGLLTFLLGFFTLTLSWFGYHTAVNVRGLRYGSMLSLGRFNLDILLIVLYGVLLIKYQSLSAVLLMLFVIYLLYALWDILTHVEYNRQDEYFRRRTTLDIGLSALVAAAFLVLFFLSKAVPGSPLAIIGIVVAFLYRLEKSRAYLPVAIK